MEEEALKGTDMRSILDTGLGINPMEVGCRKELIRVETASREHKVSYFCFLRGITMRTLC